MQRVDEDREAYEQERAAKEKPYFEIDVIEDALELRIGWQEAFLGAKDTCADSEDRDVGSYQDEA